MDRNAALLLIDNLNLVLDCLEKVAFFPARRIKSLLGRIVRVDGFPLDKRLIQMSDPTKLHSSLAKRLLVGLLLLFLLGVI